MDSFLKKEYPYNTYNTMSSSYGGFLKYGYPQIIHFRLAFSIINPPAIAVSPFMETPCFPFKWLFWGCPYFQTHPNSSLLMVPIF
jgi:hypothetical protein